MVLHGVWEWGLLIGRPGLWSLFLRKETGGRVPTIGGPHSSASLRKSMLGYWRGESDRLNLGFRRSNVLFALAVEHWTSSIPSLEKAFDRVPRGILWEVLRDFGVQGLLLRAVRSLYDRSRSLVRIAGRKSDMFPVHVGLCQGCPLSRILFIIFMDRISSSRQGAEGVIFGGCKISLLFADNVVLLASSNQDLQRALERFTAECEVAGMRIITSKSEAMVLSRKR